MDLKPRYTKDKLYEVEDNFVTSLEEIDEHIAIKIALFIQDNLRDISPNEFTTYVLGGLVHYYDKPITFAVEVMKTHGSYITLTDLALISMNEYLDLICLNSYIKIKK
jgi:hypothetical protein|tara:strand:- start:225 stop:548 length:324 start_codon:yes stop_codon:yes gene_type:complete